MIYIFVLIFLLVIQAVLVSILIENRKKINKEYRYIDNKDDVVEDILYFIILCITVLFVVYLGSI